MLAELLQLVETSLLKDADMSKEALEKRLAEIMNPAKIELDTTASLNMIDSYLSDKHGKQVLKQVVEQVKPFFLQVYREKLNEEMESILDRFRADEFSNEALELYLTFSKDPSSFKNSKILDKIANFHEELLARENTEVNDPLNSKRFAMRNILNSFGMGSSFTDAKTPKEFQEATRNE